MQACRTVIMGTSALHTARGVYRTPIKTMFQERQTEGISRSTMEHRSLAVTFTACSSTSQYNVMRDVHCTLPAVASCLLHQGAWALLLRLAGTLSTIQVALLLRVTGYRMRKWCDKVRRPRRAAFTCAGC